MDKDQIIEAIKGMSVLELNELVKACEEEFGVSAAAPVAVAAAGAAEEEEKSSYTVVLAEIGAQKIKVIKVVREITGLGLKEDIDKDEAEQIKAKLEEVGATVEFK